MKRKILLGLTMAAFVSTSAMGFGVPKINTGNSTVNSAVNKAVDMGKNKVIEDALNKDLAKKNCAFVDNSTQTTCDLNQVLNTLRSQESALKAAGLINNVTIYATAHGDKKGAASAYNRSVSVRNALYDNAPSWRYWYYRPAEKKDGSNQLELRVQVK